MPSTPAVEHLKTRNANDFSRQVNQRAAAVAGIDRRIGFNEVAICFGLRHLDVDSEAANDTILNAYPHTEGIPYTSTQSPTLSFEISPLERGSFPAFDLRTAKSLPGSVLTLTGEYVLPS